MMILITNKNVEIIATSVKTVDLKVTWKNFCAFLSNLSEDFINFNNGLIKAIKRERQMEVSKIAKIIKSQSGDLCSDKLEFLNGPTFNST